MVAPAGPSTYHAGTVQPPTLNGPTSTKVGRSPHPGAKHLRHAVARTCAAAVLAVLAGAVETTPQGRVPPRPDVVEYLSMADTYRSGHPALAVMRLRSWEDRRIEAVVRELPAAVAARVRVCPELPDDIAAATLDAAVLLHTDAALDAFPQNRLDEGLLHLDQAQKILEWLRTRPNEGAGGEPVVPGEGAPESCDAPRPIGRRDWLLAASLLSVRAWVLPAAEQFAQRATRLAPDDADVLYAAGAVREAFALNDLQFNQPPPAWRLHGSAWNRAVDRYQQALRDARSSREEAARWFRRALAAAPDRQDIRLRLGRVLSQVGKHGEAQAELEQVASLARSREERYLGALFLGRVHEAEDRVDDAIAWYERAAAINPAGHVAGTALAHALERKGLLGRAQEVLTLAVTGTSPDTADPWTAYPYGPWQIGQALLDRLRAEVTRR